MPHVSERRTPDEPSEPLPTTREALVARHAEARRKRDAAPLGSESYIAAVQEVANIEVEVARIEREMDPPKV
jgi:hypothetical protein